MKRVKASLAIFMRFFIPMLPLRSTMKIKWNSEPEPSFTDSGFHFHHLKEILRCNRIKGGHQGGIACDFTCFWTDDIKKLWHEHVGCSVVLFNWAADTLAFDFNSSSCFVHVSDFGVLRQTQVGNVTAFSHYLHFVAELINKVVIAARSMSYAVWVESPGRMQAQEKPKISSLLMIYDLRVAC